MSQEAVRLLEWMERVYTEMEAFLEAESQHLQTADWGALAQDQPRRDELTGQLSAVDAERRRLSRAAGLGEEGTLGDLLPGPPREWEERRAALRERAAEVHRRNEDNLELIQEALDRSERLLSLLTGDDFDSGYTADGQLAEGSHSSGILSRRV